MTGAASRIAARGGGRRLPPRTWPGGRRFRRAGFTLIEMLVVIAILGLAFGLVLLRGPQRSPGFVLRSEAALVRGALAQARGMALASDREAGAVALRVLRIGWEMGGAS